MKNEKSYKRIGLLFLAIMLQILTIFILLQLLHLTFIEIKKETGSLTNVGILALKYLPLAILVYVISQVISKKSISNVKEKQNIKSSKSNAMYKDYSEELKKIQEPLKRKKMFAALDMIKSFNLFYIIENIPPQKFAKISDNDVEKLLVICEYVNYFINFEYFSNLKEAENVIDHERLWITIPSGKKEDVEKNKNFSLLLGKMLKAANDKNIKNIGFHIDENRTPKETRDLIASIAPHIYAERRFDSIIYQVLENQEKDGE